MAVPLVSILHLVSRAEFLPLLTNPVVHITVGSKSRFTAGFWTDSLSLPVIKTRQWCGKFKKEAEKLWKKINTGRGPTGQPRKSQVTWLFVRKTRASWPLGPELLTSCYARFFAWKTRASRTLALELLTSCFVSSSLNHSTCKNLVSKWDSCPSHFMFVWFWNGYLRS
jgi:hypothetical protein